jgi:mycothiol synthase
MWPSVDIRPFDPDKASSSDLEQYYELRMASAADLSNEATPDFETAIGWLRNPGAGQGFFRQWTAYRQGRLVGFANIILPEHENQQLALMRIIVHPDYRRRGIGAELLRHSLAALRTLGRTQVEGWAVKKDGPGAKWATEFGFKTVHVTVTQGLSIDTVDVRLWEVPTPSGYRIVSWTRTAPDDLVASYANARNAIHDAPDGQVEYRPPQWTVERVRQAERDAMAGGIEQRVVVAAHEADGEVAGFTEVEFRPHRKDRAFQGDTAVLAHHRGNGLGRCIKARMATWLRSECPELNRVVTSTAASNIHMIRVNHQIGYTTSRTALVVSGSLSDLEARLAMRTRAG